jgi:ribonuclease R
MAVIGRHCSATERNSESAERELRKYLVLELLSTKLGEDFAGTVTGVTGQGIYLQIDRYLIDGFIRTPDLPGDKNDRWQLNRNTGALVAQRSGRTLTIGDTFPAIRIASVDLARRQLELVIVEEKRGGKRTLAQGSAGKKKKKAKAGDKSEGKSKPDKFSGSKAKGSKKAGRDKPAGERKRKPRGKR